MSVYEYMWDSYWADLPQQPNQAIWDIDPVWASHAHLLLFAQYFDKNLPVVDFGCGNGTQTKFLGEHFRHVIGIDVSEQALNQAHEINSGLNIEYRKVDLLDPSDAAALHDTVGDANVYDRTVIHQFQAKDWPAAMASLANITGQRGHAFLFEIGPTGHAYLEEVVNRLGGPPSKLAQVFKHGITPAELKEGDLECQLREAGFEIVTSGPIDYRTTQLLADGTALVIPAQYVVARPATP
ncbi:class I SAM-dependent methyltransferase [Streptomyces sp. NPDC015127]|uniref:class I SAM-dependent methyltransferase n=1 Tax=Streptomyces sp. NPDC015127 TaxID=3364939 RepID=UPI0037016DE2